MGRIKTYTNLRLKAGAYGNPETGTLGPQGLTAATVYYTSAVPCRGASMVVFRWRGTDANSPVAFAATVCNEATMLRALSAGGSSNMTVVNPGGNRMDDGVGLSVMLKPSLPTPMGVDFVQGNITTHATNPHTGVVVDADVYYDGDADAALRENGQFNLTVPA